MFQVRLRLKSSRKQGRVNEHLKLFQNCGNGNIFSVGVTGDPLGHCHKVTKTLRRMERCSALSEIFKCVRIVINIFQPNLKLCMSHRNGIHVKRLEN